MDLDLLSTTLADAGEPAYRAKQAWNWQARGAGDWDAMTDLSAGLRERLAGAVPFSTLTVENEATSRDGTIKALFHRRSRYCSNTGAQYQHTQAVFRERVYSCHRACFSSCRGDSAFADARKFPAPGT